MRLKRGQRVQLSPFGIRCAVERRGQNWRSFGVRGIVTGKREGSLLVRIDGQKRAEPYDPELWEEEETKRPSGGGGCI